MDTPEALTGLARNSYPRKHNPSARLKGRLIEAMAPLCITVLVSALVGAELARSQTSVAKPLEALAVVGLVAVCAFRPVWAAAGGILVMALPYTDSPTIPKLGTGFGIAVPALLLAALVPFVRTFRFDAIDCAVLAFALMPAFIGSFQGLPLHLTQWLAPAITIPYFGFRVLFHTHPETKGAFVNALIVVGTFLAAAGVIESVQKKLLFVSAGSITYRSDGTFATTWNVPLIRGGLLRAMTTFGHPIAFGMFLLIPLAFALVRPGRRFFAAAVVMLAAEAVTFSRGPWIATLVLLLLLSRLTRRRKGFLVAGGVAAVAFVSPVHAVVLGHAEGTGSASYRAGLVSTAFHHMTLFGKPFTDTQLAVAGYNDVTSLFASTIVVGGLLGLLALCWIVWLAARAWQASRNLTDISAVAAAACLAAQLVGLLSVTLITSYQFFFWALLAYVATFVTRTDRPTTSEPLSTGSALASHAVRTDDAG